VIFNEALEPNLYNPIESQCFLEWQFWRRWFSG